MGEEGREGEEEIGEGRKEFWRDESAAMRTHEDQHAPVYSRVASPSNKNGRLRKFPHRMNREGLSAVSSPSYTSSTERSALRILKLSKCRSERMMNDVLCSGDRSARIRSFCRTSSAPLASEECRT